MTDWTDQFAADVEAVKTDLPATLVWDDQSVAGTGSPINKTKTDALEGRYPDFDYTWVGKVSLFTSSTPPDIGDDVTISGQTYFVNGVMTDLGVVTLSLSLK